MFLIESPGCLSTRRVALAISASQGVRDVEKGPDESVKQLLSGGLETSLAPEDALQARTKAMDRGLKEATADRFT